jgi:hypothetical protein
MKAVSLVLMAALAASPVAAQTQSSAPSPENGRGALFWSGLALGVAGVTTAVLGTTVYRVEDSSSGNAPPGAYQACLAQRSDPIYAANSCDALKAKNRALLWSGVALGALGAVLVVGSARTRAEITPGFVRILHTVRF